MPVSEGGANSHLWPQTRGLQAVRWPVDRGEGYCQSCGGTVRVAVADAPGGPDDGCEVGPYCALCSRWLSADEWALRQAFEDPDLLRQAREARLQRAAAAREEPRDCRNCTLGCGGVLYLVIALIVVLNQGELAARSPGLWYWQLFWAVFFPLLLMAALGTVVSLHDRLLDKTGEGLLAARRLEQVRRLATATLVVLTAAWALFNPWTVEGVLLWFRWLFSHF